MKTSKLTNWMTALLLGAAWPLSAQPFSSGSDGSYGPLIVGTNTTLDMPPDGIFKCTTIVVSNGATLTFRRNALNTPVYLLATSNVTIDGVISVSGASGGNGVAGEGGPGGFDGGKPANGPDALTGDGYGPGGGKGGSGIDSTSSGAFSSVGYTYNGCNSVVYITNTNQYGNSLLIPLIGGSGGGGIKPSPSFPGGGSGGGGAILIASDLRVNVRGQILALGGASSDGVGRLGEGSGGAIRLVAPVVAGNGILDVFGGESYESCIGTKAGDGRIRIDATDRFSLSFNFYGPRKIGSYMQVFQNPVPRLDILEAAGQVIPEGTNAAVRVTLPRGATTNQTIRIQGRDFTGLVPIYIVVTPDDGPSTKYPAQIDMSAGNPAEITVNVVIPVDTTCQIHAWTR